VSGGDDVIHQLADRLDVAAGLTWTAIISVPAAGVSPGTSSLAVTFPVGMFSVPPAVVAGYLSSAPQNVKHSYSGLTAGGCNFFVYRTPSSATTLHLHVRTYD
jgi:hypothetical protein